MAFTLIFEGLICHISTGNNPNEKTRAVLVDLGANQAQILLPSSGNPFPLIDGDTITFDVGSGIARAQAAFGLRITGLKPTLRPDTAALLPDVLNGRHAGGDAVTAFVEYPAGALTVDRLYTRPVEYVHDDDEFVGKHCLARQAVFTSDAAAAVLTITNGGVRKTENLPSGSVVTIQNGLRTGTFGAYRGLTDATEIADAARDFGIRCAGGTESVSRIATLRRLAIPNPECSNSNWP